MIRPTELGAPGIAGRRGVLTVRDVQKHPHTMLRFSTNSKTTVSNFNYVVVDSLRLLPKNTTNTIGALRQRPRSGNAQGRGGNMRISEIEQAVRTGLANTELKARIVNEGPVAISDMLIEIEAREAAQTLTGRAIEMDSELKVQRATNGWL